MATMSAYLMAQAAQGQPHRVFDWDKAARLIRERKAAEASAGLSEDWGWTGGKIFASGAPVDANDTYVYLASNWATPVLVIDGENIECWRFQKDSPNWDSSTYWPPSALAILSELAE